jgi:hypothetical protein
MTLAPGPSIRTSTIVQEFIRLRWRALRGALRSSGTQKWTAVVGLLASVLVGVVGGVGLAVGGQRANQPDVLFVIACSVIVVSVVAIGVIAGISQPIDPRVLATEPLTDRQLAFGLLVGTAVGPPGVSGGLIGLGLFIGALSGVAAAPIVAIVAMSFLATILLVSRATINALGLFATRFPRLGQIAVGVISLLFYGGFQFLPGVIGGLNTNQQQTAKDILQYSPPGQLGLGFAKASTEPLKAIGHVAIGSVWLIPLAALFIWTTSALLVSVPHANVGSQKSGPTRRQPVRRLARLMCGTGPTGAVAWRGVRTRLRTPRTALETFTGAGIGLAVILVPTLLRGDAGAGAVLVGGAVQLAVLFMAGNSFGSDGPAMSNELLTGVDPEVLVRGKARSVAVVASPIAFIGPVIAAALTGEWRYFLAGFLVGIGGLLGGTGGAIVQSVLVPIAIPEGDNPLASGDSGKGCLAGFILAGVVLGLAVVTLPVALALLWALDRGSLPLVTVFACATLGVGYGVYRLGIRFAARYWRKREPEIYAAVIPAR